MDTYGRAIVYREIYQSGLIISSAAEAIKAAELPGEVITQRMAPPDLWNRRQDTGRSAADIFAGAGLYLTKAQNDRVQGWLDMKEWLKPTTDEQGSPTAGLRVFNTCRNLIRCLPAVQHDSRNPNDVANEPHELTHSVDAIRYFCAGRPIPTAIPNIPDEFDTPEFDRQVNDLLVYGR